MCVFLSYLSGMQITSFMRRMIVLSVASLVLTYFSTSSHKRQNSRKKITEHKVWILNLMFIGPCVFLIVEQRETNLMSLSLLFHYLMLNMFRM